MEKNNKKIIILAIAVLAIIAIIAGIIVFILNNKDYKEKTENDKNTEINQITNIQYSNEIIPSEAAKRNEEIDEQIRDLAMELEMIDHMIIDELEYGNDDTENISEEEKNMLSQMYYQRRTETIKKLKELINEIN